MKASIISMIIVLLLMIVVPLVFMGNDNLVRQMGFGAGGSSKKVDLKAIAPKNLTNVVTNEKVEIYKWRDQYGVVQFSNKPPEANNNPELIVLSPNTNIIKAIEIPKEEKKEEKTAAPTGGVSNPYTPGGIKELIEQTAGLQKLMDGRNADQQKSLEKMFKQKK